MKVIITGPTGAIGHALIDLLLANGDEVLAICHKNSKKIASLPKNSNLQILELNLDEYYDYCNYSKDSFGVYDVLYHFAWNGTFGDNRNNVLLQRDNISYSLDAVKLSHSFGCRTFIGAGSQAEYGRVDGIINEKTAPFPENGYGIAKLCAGQLTRLLCDQFDMNHIWTRILSVYGPYDNDNSMVMSSLKKLLSNADADFTRGEQEWDYLYSEDAARALYLLSLNGKKNKTYVIASGKSKKLYEFIDTMTIITESKSRITLGAIPYSEKQVMKLQADITELIEDTGFRPTIGFDKGIKKTIEYLRCIDSDN